MNSKQYLSELYGRLINCMVIKGQLDGFVISMCDSIEIVWELAKIAKEEKYPEDFQDRVLELLKSYNIDYKHLGEDKDND